MTNLRYSLIANASRRALIAVRAALVLFCGFAGAILEHEGIKPKWIALIIGTALLGVVWLGLRPVSQAINKENKSDQKAPRDVLVEPNGEEISAAPKKARARAV